MIRNRVTLLAALTVAIVVLALLSLVAGKVWVPWNVWFGDSGDPRWSIILQLRVPRTLLGILVGAALGLSGAALQGFTRNPLADPGVLGVSSMGALGAVLTIYFGLAAKATWMIAAAAIGGAGIGVVALLALAGSSASVITFLLAGVILNAVAGAATALALNLAPSPYAVNEIIDWLMGSLQDRSMVELRLAAPFIIVGGGLLLMIGRALDALTLGDTGARALGVDLNRTRLILIAGLGLATGASVAVTGVIGFVGLVVPHLLRSVVGSRPGALLVPSALAGSALVLAADIVVRLTPSSNEVKLGAAMAVLGGPFFLAMLVSMRRKLA